jgi:hypothetical protein
VSAQFSATLDRHLRGVRLDPAADRVVQRSKDRPLAGRPDGRLAPGERATVTAAIDAASLDGFHVGMGVAGGLVILGGVVSLVGIANPRRKVLASDCGGGAVVGASEDVGRVPELRIPGDRLPRPAMRQV